MNTENVISLPSSDVALVPNRRVKLTVNGVAHAAAADAFIGTLLPGDLNREQAAVLRKQAGLHFGEMSNSTALAVGDEIEGADDGKIRKLNAGTAIGQAAEAGGASGDVIRVVYY